MPPGSFDRQPATIPDFVDTVNYRASVFSGHVTITASSDSIAPIEQLMIVQFPGLVEYVETAHDLLVGDNSKHPDNHFATPAMVAMLNDLSTEFHARFGQRLHYNDMSLALGGKLRTKEAVGYEPGGGHHEHRAGESVDLRTRWPVNLEDSLFVTRTERGNFVWAWWKQRTGSYPLDEGPPDTPERPPHWHQRLPGDSNR